ncbi:hypothetical protein [Streptomyces sp. NPDC057284]|uniref:hypothetical protein n=1 Tax=Streptomyces sp. NPDC057284 TaxID=3346083 RepID=UPI00362BEFE5
MSEQRQSAVKVRSSLPARRLEVIKKTDAAAIPPVGASRPDSPGIRLAPARRVGPGAVSTG